MARKIAGGSQCARRCLYCRFFFLRAGLERAPRVRSLSKREGEGCSVITSESLRAGDGGSA